MSSDANFPGTPVAELDTPVLMVDLDLLESNIARMSALLGAPGAKLERLSEEHGKVTLSDGAAQLQPGEKVEVIPSHACTTINLHDRLYGVRNGRLEVVWPIAGRGKLR